MKVVMNEELPEIKLKPFNLEYVGVKAPQFSFTRLLGADPTLSVEMASTGEVGCIGADFEEAFLKAMLSVGFKLPVKSVLLSTGSQEDKVDFLPAAIALHKKGVQLYATSGTAKFLTASGIECQTVAWPSEDKADNALDLIRESKVDLVINIPKNYQQEELSNGYKVRRAAVDFGIPLITNLQLAKRLAEALSVKDLDSLEIKSWREYRALH